LNGLGYMGTLTLRSTDLFGYNMSMTLFRMPQAKQACKCKLVFRPIGEYLDISLSRRISITEKTPLAIRIKRYFSETERSDWDLRAVADNRTETELFFY